MALRPLVSTRYMQNSGDYDPHGTLIKACERNGINYQAPYNEFGEYSLNCPAHQDDKASLHAKVTGDSRLLFDCKAGCEFKDILAGLGLVAANCRPDRQFYHYYATDGEYQFTVERNYFAPEKNFRQGSMVDGVFVPGVPEGADTNQLFLAPEFVGTGAILYWPEGEKDALNLHHALRSQGRLDAFATSSAGGAGRNFPDEFLKHWMDSLAPREVVILTDNDESKKGNPGRARGLRLWRQLTQLYPNLRVRVLRTKEPYKDITEALERSKSRIENWEDLMEEVEVNPQAALFKEYEGTAEAGLIRLKNDSGRINLAMKWGDSIKTVLTGDLVPMGVMQAAEEKDGRAFMVKVIPTLELFPEQTLTLSSDVIRSSRAFESWIQDCIGFGFVPDCGISPARIVQALKAFIDFELMRNGKPQYQTPAAHGWVDNEGEAWDVEKPEIGEGIHFIRHDGSVLASDGSDVSVAFAETKYVPKNGRTQYTTDHDEVEMVDYIWRSCLMHDAKITAPILGYLSSTLLAPFIQNWTHGHIRPGLTIVAPSGSGKTSGAPSLLFKAAGCQTNNSGTEAGVRRELAMGVGTFIWLDDSDVVENPGVKEVLRQAASGSTRTQGNQEKGATGTDTIRYSASTIITTEGLSWLNETSMQDRFIQLSLTSAQHRKSLYVDRNGLSQSKDFAELKGRHVSPGSVIQGLVRTALKYQDEFKAIAREREESPSRRYTVLIGVHLGFLIAKRWMEETRDQAVSLGRWKEDMGDLGLDLEWLEGAMDKFLLDEEDETEETSCTLVNEAIPLLYALHTESATPLMSRGNALGPQSGYLWTGIEGQNPATLKQSLLLRLGDMLGSRHNGMPAGFLTADGHLWVSPLLVSMKMGRRSSTEARTWGPSALASQASTEAVNSTPVNFRNGDGCFDLDHGGGIPITYYRISELALKRAKAHM